LTGAVSGYDSSARDSGKPLVLKWDSYGG
jgi:hypothetical protein